MMRTRELVACLAALVGASCASTNLEHAYIPHEAGAFTEAAEIAEGIELKRQVDRIWVLLERGKMQQDAGHWQKSVGELEEADQLFEVLDESAVISAGAITNTASALLTDDRSLDFTGNGFDRILLGVAMVVNYLELGDFETAAVYARRQQDRQREVQERNAKEIAQLSEREQASKDSKAEVSLEEVEGQEDYQKQTAELDSWLNPAYADFSVPYGYFVAYVAYGAAQRFGEQARALEDLRGILPDNPYLKELTGQRGLGNRVYVLFENGVAPMRVDKSFFYISPLGVTNVPIPGLVVRAEGRAKALRLTADGTVYDTRPVDQVDQMVAQEFKSALLGIWLRAIVAVVLKEVATAQAENQLGGWGILIGSIAKSVVRPDTRTWRSLPGEHQIAQFERPESGKVGATVIGGYGTHLPPLEIELPGEGACLLWVRTTAPGGLAIYPAPLDKSLGERPAGWSTDVGAQ